MDIYEQITKMADEIAPELVAQRRDFHKFAEKGWFEMRTSSIIARKLTEMGYEVLVGDQVCKKDARMGVPSDEELEEQYERAVAQGADPEFVNKAQQGRVDEIVHCVGCNQGCYDGFCDVANRPHITCMRNPMIGHEAEYELKKAEDPKKVWVIGGGVAGMEAAKVLQERGHEVTLFEASDALGGEFLLAGEAPGKAEMKAAAMEMGNQIEKLVSVHKNTKVDAQMLENADVDAVILAIGSSPIEIRLEGMDKLSHVSAPEVLRHEVNPKGKVAVIGGGLVGLETADALACAGCEVTVLEMKDSIGSDLGSLRKIAVMMKMQQLQVKLLPNSKVCRFTEEGIVLEDNTLIPCDCAVFAVGFAANDSHALAEVCEKRDIPYHVIGDARSARRALDAIAEGFEVARTL